MSFKLNFTQLIKKNFLNSNIKVLEIILNDDFEKVLIEIEIDGITLQSIVLKSEYDLLNELQSLKEIIPLEKLSKLMVEIENFASDKYLFGMKMTKILR